MDLEQKIKEWNAVWSKKAKAKREKKREDKKQKRIKEWNNMVSKLPPLDSKKKYLCEHCDTTFELSATIGDITAYGIDIECPVCGKYVGFEPLGYSKWD